ncbi:MAG: hypothetical protein GXN94_01490 [Aquificae bacterium]|nr:hypothetical protein [Aquificota bacterium]
MVVRITGFYRRRYFWYRFFNSVFAGLSIGSVFTIYTPLKPSVYSLGGILLAVGMLAVAKFYERLMELKYFFYILFFVEAVVFFLLLYFLLSPYTYTTALLIYAGYQITFIFGSYIVRTETLFLGKKKLLSLLDIFKQSGYLAGMVGSFLFYRTAEVFFGIKTNQEKVYLMHFLLLAVQVGVLITLVKSFKIRRNTVL